MKQLHAKSPARETLYRTIRADEARLAHLKIIHAERCAVAMEADLQERECFAEIEDVIEALENAREALRDLIKMERCEGRSAA